MRLGFSSSCKGAAACCQLQAHPLCSFLTKSSLCFLSRNVAFLHLFTKYDRTRVICDWNGCMHWRYDHSHGTAERVFIGRASEANFCINRADAFHTRVLSQPANTQCDVRCIGAQIFFSGLKDVFVLSHEQDITWLPLKPKKLRAHKQTQRTWMRVLKSKTMPGRGKSQCVPLQYGV